MNREDIIRMAREADEHADLVTAENALLNWYEVRDERFAALVASAERESLRESFRVVTAAEASAAILHEREACARLCEENDSMRWSGAANAIRARGQA